MRSALREGLRAVVRTWRMSLVFWVSTLAFALAVTLPASALLSADLGHSLYAGRMLENFDPQWVIEFLSETRGSPLVVFGPLIAVVAAGYLLLQTFLTGGALAIFAGPERSYRPDRFFEGCGRNFGRLLRLLLVSLACYALALAAHAGLHRLGHRLWGEGMEERPLLIFSWCSAALLLALFLLINMVSDYAKIRLVVEDSRQALRAAAGSLKLVARNPGLTSATYLSIACLAALLFLLYLAIPRLAPRAGILWLALALLLQQCLVLARAGVKLLFFASQLEIYRESQEAGGKKSEARSQKPEVGGEEIY